MDRATTQFQTEPPEQKVPDGWSGNPRFIEPARWPSSWPKRGDCSAGLAGRDWFIKRILVPTNYSEASVEAVRRAVAIANQCEATLTVLHVIDVSAQSEPGAAEDFTKRLWNDGCAQMARLAGSLVNQVDGQTMLAEGLPWEVIVENSGHFDLVVLGEASTKRGWDFFCKHTARRVIEHAACPVMVIRA